MRLEIIRCYHTINTIVAARVFSVPYNMYIPSSKYIQVVHLATVRTTPAVVRCDATDWPFSSRGGKRGAISPRKIEQQSDRRQYSKPSNYWYTLTRTFELQAGSSSTTDFFPRSKSTPFFRVRSWSFAHVFREPLQRPNLTVFLLTF